MIPVAAYPKALVEALLNWCVDSAPSDATAVTCIGLAYGCGLNEHQIAAARVVALAPSVSIAFSLARRADEVRRAAERIIVLDHPDWLIAAIRSLSLSEGSLILRPASPIGVPRSASFVRTAIADASERATGHRLTCSGLARSRLVDASEAGHKFAAYGIGYAASYESRLVDCRRVPHLPRRR